MAKVALAGVWIIVTAAFFLISSLPTDVSFQFALSLCCLLCMVAIKLANLRGPFRAIFLGLGTFVILRYLFWRLSSSLPPVTPSIDFVIGFTLFIAEVYCIAMMFLSLFSVADPIDRKAAPKLLDNELPSVDIFVPSYNEAPEIVAPTLAAAKAIRYPADRLNIYLLDDGATDEKRSARDSAAAAQASTRRRVFQKLCSDLGVNYLSRERNDHAKAGNLNHGLNNSQGALVVVLDADHSPAPEFLEETVGYFHEDDKLFLVQTPHFFLNPDPIEKNLGFSRMPAENEMFYGLVQKGLDKWNAAFFCGSAAVLRREALDEVGGFHGSSVTEDAESALELHSRGWRSLYVDRPMVAGLQPETFAAFIGQRVRWCQGMIQILMLKNPLWTRGLNLGQRLSYLSSSLFWLFPLSRIVFLLAPMAYIFFDLKIYMANTQEFVAYTVTYMASALLIQSYMFGRVRGPWVSDVYEYIQSVLLLPAAVGVFFNPRRPQFKVTAKGQNLNEDRLSVLATPYFLLFGLVAASLVVLAYRFVHEPDMRALNIVVGAWSAMNLALTGMALGAVSETRERRSAPRIAIATNAEIVVGDHALPASLENLSTGGFCARLIGHASVSSKSSAVLRIALEDGSGAFLETPCVNMGRSILGENRPAHFKFVGLESPRFRIIAKYMFANISGLHSERLASRRTHGVVRASLEILAMAAKQILRGFHYLLFRGAPNNAPAATNEPAGSSTLAENIH